MIPRLPRGLLAFLITLGLLGGAAALIQIALGFIWPLFLVAFGFAGLAYLAARFQLPARQLSPPVGFDVDGIRRNLASLLASMIGQVSIDVITRYQSIHQQMLEMLPRAGQLGTSSEDLYILQRTASDYLPTAFGSYLSLVHSHATEQRLAGGRTPHEALMEQLDLIETKLTEVSDALNRNDVDNLLAHGRFLEDRFGTPDHLGLEPPQ